MIDFVYVVVGYDILSNGHISSTSVFGCFDSIEAATQYVIESLDCAGVEFSVEDNSCGNTEINYLFEQFGIKSCFSIVGHGLYTLDDSGKLVFSRTI